MSNAGSSAQNNLPNDPHWPRASAWLKMADANSNYDLGLFGIPAHLTSISKTNAHLTPNAIRDALQRYSTFNWTTNKDVSALSFADFGDVTDPDSTAGEDRTAKLAHEVSTRSKLAIGLGGDNSVTYAMAKGVFANNIATAGLITFDAHHDLRDGISNGSPVRRLVDEAGLDGKRIVQIGIADFSNSAAYAKRAKDFGIHVMPRTALRSRSAHDVVAEALQVAGAAGGPIHVDFDVDVCDRAAVPGCPAAAPGGISADEFRAFCFEIGQAAGRARIANESNTGSPSAQIKSVDFTEIDASADSADGRTVRLAALGILELAAGFML
jgi:arginase family enzyme